MANDLLITFLLLFVFATFPECHVATTDSLFPNQNLVPGQTLISQDQVFVLGFFSPGRSKNTFLGVWYKSTPSVCVWVANRNDPIDPNHSSQGVFFSMAENTTLVIGSGAERSIIWTANASAVASNPVLQLLNTGNLVMINQDSSHDRSNYIWESFDYPTDTWLPGMKMVDDPHAGMHKYLTSWRNSEDPSPGDYVMKVENQGLPEIVIYKGKTKTFRSGTWNGIVFCGIMLLPIPNPIFKPRLIFKEERLISMMEYHDSSVIVRTQVSPSGVLHRYIMNSRRDDWKFVTSLPMDMCDQYGQCGPNGICSVDKPVRCECLKGFTPKIPNDWELQDWSGGCTRTKSQLKNRHSGDGFLEVRRLKYPDMLRFWLNTSMSLNECRDECLRNYTCTAYANPYVTNGGYGCVMWFGDLIDVKEHPSADSKQNIYIRLSASELDSVYRLHLPKDKDNEKKRPTKLLLISIASGVLVSGFINGLLRLVARHKGRVGNRDEKELEVPSFKLETIVAATNNFAYENVIGEGGFGPVYRGRLTDEEEIAVKRLSSTSSQGLEEFKNEVILIAKLQHRNLVRLLGCCIDGAETILIYEYLQNKSLDYFLFDQSRRRLLTWPKRFEIIMGIARGLVYLHHDSRLKVIHRDLKASNILLDRDLNPKIADFGIARSFGEDQCIAQTKRVVGTFGYMAPEYATAGNFSVKSDVFSMGVVLLEIVSGIKNRGFDYRDGRHTLLGHVWLLWKEDRILEIMDECMKETFVESEVKRCLHVGLLCVQNHAKDRPSMSSVIPMLATDGAVLAEPNEPGFFTVVRKCPSPPENSYSNTMTITDLEAR